MGLLLSSTRTLLGVSSGNGMGVVCVCVWCQVLCLRRCWAKSLRSNGMGVVEYHSPIGCQALVMVWWLSSTRTLSGVSSGNGMAVVCVSVCVCVYAPPQMKPSLCGVMGWVL